MNKINTAMFLIMGFGSIFGARPALAQYYSQGTQKYEISVDKKVKNPDNKTFVDNIDYSKKVFSNNEQIEFQIIVTNNGNETLNDVKVKDTLPRYLSLVIYPGSYDSKSNVLTWTIESLKAGESKTFLIKSKIVDVPAGSVSNINIKQTNCAYASNLKANDSDCSVYFLTKPVAPVTGDIDFTVKTALSIAAIGSALVLRKLARGY